jgi:hypothetical protein
MNLEQITQRFSLVERIRKNPTLKESVKEKAIAEVRMQSPEAEFRAFPALFVAFRDLCADGTKTDLPLEEGAPVAKKAASKPARKGAAKPPTKAARKSAPKTKSTTP